MCKCVNGRSEIIIHRLCTMQITTIKIENDMALYEQCNSIKTKKHTQTFFQKSDRKIAQLYSQFYLRIECVCEW